MKSAMQKAWGYILEIFFAPLCVGCGKYLSFKTDNKTLVCNICFDGIPIYKTVFYNPRFTLSAVSSYDNEAVRKLLQAFKYRGFEKAKRPIEALIGKYLDGVNLRNMLPKNTIIIPIPLHKKRLRERGFNQAEEIAKILGSYLGLPIQNKVLIKTLDTKHQTSLANKDERLKNVSGSLAISKDVNLKGKNILLVDDVYTTGATIGEAMKVLRRVGVNEIFVFVVAKTS